MLSGSLASAGHESKRRRVVPLPKGIVAMQTFMPDSSVVSDVIPSPNFGERNKARRPDMIVLHYTGMPDVEGALTRLCKAGTEVSAHYVVLEDGRILQCVPESKRAWHAGVAKWAGEDDINSCSIGIEIINRGHDWGYPDYPLRQIAAVITLCRGIIIRRNVPPHRVLGHSDVAPSRKKDPGEKFPWRSLAASGVGHWVEPAPIEAGAGFRLGAEGEQIRVMQQALADYGYGIAATGKYDPATVEVVSAFQRHFRPEKVDGVADGSTLATLHALLGELPIDVRATAALT
ncbi:N-acetylmuramoyl-L-alanine amidase [Rhodopseudomonas pseudopalustris]|uniref:N-acetylmuramoyl-L-alanine amidase n=1 Tax=Rhodopseudomonas pseudopalustris TaxID=1513892 RepID=A0A1H8QFX9_9BRAD|nr:N-acetylmuramoyl-L-alanine amidase [Rhodopseudomonas pseudopalustris]MBB1091374.1 N-acetylmuramoyl-L-alanine amidase [Rhodopseudomonas palustris]SEO52817.1 N-acetylmuramoyl-L-alanine amidase [Rhodopseudomonas pseudopalustris]